MMTTNSTRFVSNAAKATARRSARLPGGFLEALEPRKLLTSAPIGGSILFVDHDILDAASSIRALPGTEVVFLDGDRDGFEQVSAVLAGRRGLDSIQFASHGSSARFGLGASQIDALSLHDRAGTIAGWGDALSDDGDILLWGCDVASDAAGRAFVRDLASISRADVAASINSTGNKFAGSDWVLEFRLGSVGSQLASPFMPSYQYVLGVPNDSPVISGTTAFQSVTDIGTNSPFSGVSVTDTENDTLAVSVTLDDAAKGVFTPASLTASGFTSAGGGVYTFSGTPSAVSAALALLVFDPTDNRVTPGATELTTFTINANDGLSTPTTDNTTSVFSVSVNDAPIIGGVSTLVTIADTGTVQPFPNITIADADNPAQTLTVSITLDTAAKGVFTPASLSASGFTDAGGGSYTFSGTAAATQAAMRQLYFDPTNNRVAPGTTEITTFTISVNDGVAAAVTNNQTNVYSVSVNDAPTIGGASAGQAVNDNATITPFSAVTIADVDSPAQTLSVSVTLDSAAKGVFTSASLMSSGFTDAGSGVYTFSGTAAAAQTAIRLLAFDPTNNRVAVGMTETTTFTITVNDGMAANQTNNTTTAISTSVNDAPTIGGTSAGQAVNENATVTPFSAVTIGEVDPGQTLAVSVSLDTAAKGVFTPASLTASGFTDAGGGVYTLSGVSAAAAQTAIRLLAFDPANNRVDTGMTETTTFTISVDDGVAAAVTDNTTTVISTAVNDAPTIGGVSAGQTVNDTATVTPFSAATIVDADTPADTLSISVTLDDAAKGIFTSASLMASGFADAGGGVYTFSGNAAAAQTAIRQLVFNPADNRVNPGMTETTTFTISADDGIATAVTNNTTTVISTSVNDAPTIGGTSAGQAVNDNATVTLFSAVTIADADAAQSLTVTVTLDDAAKGVFTPASLTASGFVDSGSGVYTLSGVTAAAAQTAIRLLAFDPANNRVAVGMMETTTFTISVNDAIAAAATDNTTTVISTSINDAPTIGGTSAGQTVNDNANVSPFSAVTIVDGDPTQTVDVSVSLDTAAKGVFTPASLTASGFTDAGGGVYTLTGVAASAAQTAIRQLVFNPANDRVAVGMTETTTFTISVDDGVASAVTDNTTTVISTSVNDAPTIGGASAGQATNDNANVSLFSAVTIADSDSPAQTLTVSVTLDDAAKGVFTPASLSASGFTDAGSGVYTFSGTASAAQTAIQQLVFNPTNDRVAVGMTETTTFTISVNDGVASAVTNNTTTVISTSANDAPTIGGASAGQAVNDTATITPFASVTIADVDPSQSMSVSVTLDTAAKGVFTPASLTASGFTDAGGGAYTFSGSASAAQTAIRLLAFDPANNRVAPGMTETTTFTISVNDGVAAAVTDNTTTAISTSVNDAPTIGGASAGQAVNDNATVEPFTAITFADPDTAQTVDISVTLDNAAKGVFTAGSLTASGFTDAGGGVYTLSGVTASAAQAAIRQLVFNPTNDRVAVGMTETTTFTISIDDGVASPVTNNTTTVISTSINDAPTIGGTSAGQAVNENATVTPFSSVTIVNPDPSQNVTVTVTLDSAAKGVFTSASLTSSGFTDAGGGVYTHSGSASAMQTAIRLLAFDPADNRVDTGMTETTTFTISVNDGVAAAATDNTTTVISTAVNEAPTIGGVSAGQTTTDTANVSPFSAVTIADADTPAATLTVSVSLDSAAKGVFTPASLSASGFTDAGGGVYTFSGTAAASQTAIRQLVFNPTDNRVAQGSTETTTFTISADDGVAAASTNNTTTVITSGVNDAPTIGATSAGQVVNDNATVTLFSAVTIADVDPSQTLNITVTLDDAAKGVFTSGSLAASGFTDAGGGVYTFSGTASASQTAIRQLVFNPTNDRVAVGMTETTTFTISVDDSIAAAVTDNTTTVISTSINDAPTIGGTSAGQAVNDNATITLFSAVTITNPDPSQNVSVSVTLDTAAKGVFTPASLTASGFADAGGGVYTFTGLASAAQTGIRLLAFDPANNRVAVGMTETTTFTISVDDGVAAAATDNTTTAISTSINDAPTIGGTSAGQMVNDNATILPFAAVTFADVDSPAQTLTITVTLSDASNGLFTAGSLTASGFTDAGGGVYTHSGSAAAMQTAIRQLVFNPTDNRVTPGTSETTTFTISADDGVATAVTDNTTTVLSLSINDATVIGGTSAGQAVNDNATVTPFSAVTFADIDNPAQTQTFSVTLDNAAKGVFTPGSLTASGFVDAGSGVYTFSGTHTAAQTAIRQLVFNPTNDRVAPGMTETTTFTITAFDGSATATDNTTTVISTSINDAPTIGGTSAGQTVNDTATIMPFAMITVTDPDSGQTQTVSITLDSAAKGVFTPASLTAAGFADAGGGVYTFTGSAANAQSGMRQLVFNPTDNRVDTGMTETTTFTISVDDGVAAAATDNTTTVISESVNDAPTIGGTSAGQTVNDTATVTPFAAVTFADADSPVQTQTVTVTLDNAAKGVFTSASLMASGFTDAGGGAYTFSGNAADSQTAIRQLVFNPTNDRVAVGMTETTTFTISINDGVASAVTNNSTTVISTSINDAPTLGGTSAGQTVNENSTVNPFSAVTIADVDPSQTLSVSVSLDTAAKGVFTPASLTASGFVDAGSGVYTFSGTAAAAQTAIRLLAFDPTDNRVDTGMTETTTFTISVDDGVAAAVTDNTTTVVSTAVNVAPSIAGTSAGQGVNDNATLLPFSSVTIADADTPTQTLSVFVSLDVAAKGTFTSASLTASGFTDAGGGVYTLSGVTAAAAQTAIRLLAFDPTENRVAVGSTETTTFTISVDDGVAAASTNNITTVVSTSINDASTIGGVSAGQTVNDNASLSPFSAVTIADVDPSQTFTVTVTLDAAAKGAFTPASLTASGFSDAGSGVYSLSGASAAAAQSAIRQLVFQPTENRVAVGMTETTTFTLSVDDGATTPVTNNATTVISTSINNAPTLGGASSGQTVNDNAATSPFSSFTIADVDPSQTLTVTVTIDSTAKGAFTPASLTASGFSDAGSGVYSLSGVSASAAQSAIRQLVFQPTENRVAVGMTETSTFTVGVDDGVAAVVSDNTTTIISTSINDAPTVGGASSGQTVNDNATNSPFSAFTISDVDPSQNVSVTIALDGADKGAFTAGSLSASGFSTSVPGIYTLSGVSASAAQAAIRQLVFQPTENRVAVGMTETTAFAVLVSDGIDMVLDNSTTVISTSINNAPTLGGATPGQTTNDTVNTSPFASFTIADVDPSQTLDISVTIDAAAKGVFTPASLTASGFVSAGSGVYTLSGVTASAAQTAIRQLVFNPADNRVAPGLTETATFTVAVNDGVATAVTNNSTTVISTSVNDTPVVSGSIANQTVNENQTITPFSGIVFSDADPGQTYNVGVFIYDLTDGTFTPESLAASGFVPASSPNNAWSLSGVTIAQAQAAVRLLAFNPADNVSAVGATNLTNFTVALYDLIVTGADTTTSVLSTGVNDPTILGGSVPAQTTNDTATLSPFSSFTIADPDPGQTFSVSVSLDNAAKGVFTSASLTASGFVNAGSGVYTFSGTAAAAQTAIRQLVFNPADYRVAPGMTETTTFNVSVNDSLGAPATNNATTVISTSTNAVPTLSSINILTGSTARSAHTISYNALFVASNAADANSSQTILFRIEDIQNGTLTKNGDPVTEGVTTLGPSESLVWTSDGSASGTTTAFTVRAFDGTAPSATPIAVRLTVTPIDPNTAAIDAPIAASSSSSGTVSVVTRNDAGDTILLQQSSNGSDWTRINLSDAGVPGVTGGTSSFVDPATGRSHVSVVTADGLFLVSDDGNGNWTSRNLTTELGGPTIVGELASLTTTDGVNVVGGRTASGDLVIYNQTGANSSEWTARNLYDALRNQNEPTPTFTSPIITYVTSWNGLNFGGLDSSGNIWTVWTGGGINEWHATNLSAITGAPTLVGGVTAYTTPWGGINLAGVNTDGDLTITWWVPQFGGTWVQSNFTQEFGGPRLVPGTIASYVTNWNALNIAGATEDGEIVQYWWVPPSSPDQDFWRVTPLTADLDPSLRRPNTGVLTGFATQDSRLNLIGSSEDGHIIRLWWSPTTNWALEDLTALT